MVLFGEVAADFDDPCGLFAVSSSKDSSGLCCATIECMHFNWMS